MFLLYLITIFISVATFSINATVRAKNLTATTSFAKMKSLTWCLLFLMIFNILDFNIIYFRIAGYENIIKIIYVIEDIVEVIIAYMMVALIREYDGKSVPRWVDAVFIICACACIFLDLLIKNKSIEIAEGIYILTVIAINAIPIIILLVIFISLWLKRNEKPKSKLTYSCFIIYILFSIIICFVTTVSTADELTKNTYFYYNKYVYILLWILFNVYNLFFVWITLNVDERSDTERIISPEDRINSIAEIYSLSDREKEIAMLLFEGKNNNEIAGELFLSPNTVKVHASNLYHKLGANNRVQAVQVLRGEKLDKI